MHSQHAKKLTNYFYFKNCPKLPNLLSNRGLQQHRRISTIPVILNNEYNFY